MAKHQKDTAIYVAFDDYSNFDPARPEKNLLRAILMNALSDLRKPGEIGKRAKEYLLSPEEDYIFSFNSVCSYLDVDPKKILTVAGLNGTGYPGIKQLSQNAIEALQGEWDPAAGS